jgi:methylmalonyl-CoA mutase
MDSRKKKLERFSSGRDQLVGTNTYPDFNQEIQVPLEKPGNSSHVDSPMVPLTPFRPSSVFEEVRLTTEKSEKRPRVLLFKYGNPAWATNRAVFAGSFLACAGYEILEQPLFSSIKTGIKISRNIKAEVVVLCSSDDEYAELAPQVYDELKEFSLVMVAGFPLHSMERLKEKGIVHYIHRDSNLLETLQELNSILL